MVVLDNPFWENIPPVMDYDFFIKDYVKSIKTAEGVERIPKDIKYDDLCLKLHEFVKERGKLFTGGIVLKEFVELKKYGDNTNEWRVFYFNGEFLTYFQNSNLKTKEHPPLRMIKDVGELIDWKSNFFTVDFAQTEDGNWIVIETGDGQVSGLAEGKELLFYNAIFNKTIHPEIVKRENL
jgi:hypothetical protein